jgi:hypothetical protein
MNEDYELLEENGWEVECESPFEIRNGESFASNLAAESVVNELKLLEKVHKVRKAIKKLKKGKISQPEFAEKIVKIFN